MRLFVIFAFASLLVATAAALNTVRLPQAPTVKSFLDFAHKYNKVYADEHEVLRRYNNFAANLQRIEELRAEHLAITGEKGDAVFGVTKFADLTREEFNQYKGFTPRARASLPVIKSSNVSDVPDSWDWRTYKTKVVTPVKDQGQCGSCWAFSATEEIESSWAMAGNSLVELSVQQIVSCDDNDGGCDGGDTITAYEYVEGVDGVESESAYPYTSGNGNTGSCKYKKGNAQVAVSGYSYATPPCTGSCNNQDEDTLQTNLYNEGPVSICVNANDAWQLYTGGVLSSSCSHAYSDLDHCVQLIGYNDGSSPYWIIRNSWNTDWGIDGYIYVAKGKNLCGVADEATLVSTVAPK